VTIVQQRLKNKDIKKLNQDLTQKARGQTVTTVISEKRSKIVTHRLATYPG
jgi:hypothetical protein